jgi:phage gp36-like protein
MAYLTTAEISSHLYAGVVAEISRDEESILEMAIAAAIEEARGYLTAYDVPAIFAAVEDARNPIVLLYIKDIAVWHYIQLSNPGVEMELRQIRYEKATKYFEKIQNGKVNPSLPYPAAPPAAEAESYIKYGSIEKRINNF